MVFEAVGTPLRAAELPVPSPAPGELLLQGSRVRFCRTDLHLLDGEVSIAAPPRVLGHQIVASVAGPRAGTRRRRVGVPWLGWTCGECRLLPRAAARTCASARASPAATSTAAWREYTVADERFCFPIPDGFRTTAGGAAAVRRADRLPRAADVRRGAERLGLYGFGAAAHILCQVARWQGRGSSRSRAPATRPRRRSRASSARPGPAARTSRRRSRSTPRSSSLPTARSSRSRCAALAPGGVVVCGGIHMSEIPAFDYDLLWHERSASLGRQPDAPRRRGVPRAGRPQVPRPDPRHELSARGGERGTRRSAPRPLHRRRRADARVSSHISTRRRPRKLRSRCSR